MDTDLVALFALARSHSGFLVASAAPYRVPYYVCTHNPPPWRGSAKNIKQLSCKAHGQVLRSIYIMSGFKNALETPIRDRFPALAVVKIHHSFIREIGHGCVFALLRVTL